MTEKLLDSLEGKVVTLVSEVETLRKEIQRLNYENASLKGEKENNGRKLQELIQLLDSINVVGEVALDSATSIAA